MLESDAWERLRHFRRALYDDLGLRQDSLFELVDAALTAAHRSTLVRLSLTAVFRRRWPSTCDALADGSVDCAALRQLFARTLADSAVVDGRPLWVIDGTNWPRPAARASAERTWEYRPLPGWPQSGIVPAWAYQWLVAVPDAAGSWVLPLDMQRRGPTAKSATEVALAQIAEVRAAQGGDAPRPVVTLDSEYDLETLANASVDADLLVRLIKSRVLYRTPTRSVGPGRPRLHGEPFRLADQRTHGQPQQSARLDHPLYGTVQIDVWTELHVGGAPDAPFRVIRVQVEASAEQEAATSALVVSLDRRPAADGHRCAVALVLASFHGGARVPLLQADARLDDRSPSLRGSSRPLDLADCWRVLAVVVGPRTRERRPSALGTSASGWLADARPGPSQVQWNIAPDRYSGSCTSHARKITGAPNRRTSTAPSPLRSSTSTSASSRIISQNSCPNFNI